MTAVGQHSRVVRLLYSLHRSLSCFSLSCLQAAPYVQWCCTALEHVLPLRRIRHVKWRGQLYTAACLLYSAAGMPVQSEVKWIWTAFLSSSFYYTRRQEAVNQSIPSVDTRLLKSRGILTKFYFLR